MHHLFSSSLSSLSLSLSLNSHFFPLHPFNNVFTPFSLSLFFFLLVALPHYSSTSTMEYLKLPLLPCTPLPSPSYLLAIDFHHLSAKSPPTFGIATGSGQYFVDLCLGSLPNASSLSSTMASSGSNVLFVAATAPPPSEPSMT